MTRSPTRLTPAAVEIALIAPIKRKYASSAVRMKKNALLTTIAVQDAARRPSFTPKASAWSLTNVTLAISLTELASCQVGLDR